VPKRGIPRTPNGKLQRHTCREALLGGQLRCLWEDAGEVEAFLADQIAMRLGLRDRSTASTCSLTAAGGDSLTAVQLAQMLEQQYGVAVSPADLLSADSIATMADA